MAKVKTQKDSTLHPRRAVDLSVRGSTGLRAYGGRLVDEVLPKMSGTQGLRVYSEMITDSTIWSGIYAMRTFLAQAEFRIAPAVENDNAAALEAAFIEECMRDLRPNTWDQFFGDIMTMLDQGFAPFEVSYKLRSGTYVSGCDDTFASDYSDRRIGWRDISLRSQDTLDRWDWDAYGNVAGMLQWVYGDITGPQCGGSCFIPREKMLLFRTLTRANSPQGRSILRAAVVPYFRRKKLEDINDIGIERDLTGYPVLEVPEELLDPENPDTTQLQGFYRMITDVRRDEREGCIIPSELTADGKPSGYKFRLMTSGGTRAIPILDTIKRYDQRMLGGMLAEFVLLGQDNAGASRSMHGSKKDVFGLSLRTMLNNIANEINRNLIGKLCFLNGVHPDLYPTIEYGDISAPELAEVAQYITALSNVGVDLTDSETERRLREMGDLPDKPDPDSDATRLPPVAGRMPLLVPRPSQAPEPPPPSDARPPDVAATVEPNGAATPAPGPLRAAHEGEDLQQVSLNGAQIAAILQVIQQEAQGIITRSSALAIMTTAFPITQAQAEAMLGQPKPAPPGSPALLGPGT